MEKCGNPDRIVSKAKKNAEKLATKGDRRRWLIKIKKIKTNDLLGMFPRKPRYWDDNKNSEMLKRNEWIKNELKKELQKREEMGYVVDAKQVGRKRRRENKKHLKGERNEGCKKRCGSSVR